MPAKKVSNTPRAASAIDKHVGERVRAARNAAGLSQAELGDKLGVSFQQIQKYEKGTNRVSCGALVLIAAALAAKIEWFFEGAPGVSKADKTVAKISMFYATTGAAELADDFVRLQPEHRAAVRHLASHL